MRNIEKGAFNWLGECWYSISDEAKDLVWRMMQRDPKKCDACQDATKMLFNALLDASPLIKRSLTLGLPTSTFRLKAKFLPVRLCLLRINKTQNCLRGGN